MPPAKKRASTKPNPTPTAPKGGKPKKAEAAPPAPVVVTAANETMTLKQVTSMLNPNPEVAWCKSGKWPCLLDPNTTAGTFLKYRNVNYLEAASPTEMTEERIRLALLGGLRFGKPLVIDMGSIDMFHVITTQVNNLQAGLMDKILDKSILLEENFKTLVKSSDEDDYRPDKFTGGMADQFVFILLSSRDVPPPNASDKFYYILLE